MDNGVSNEAQQGCPLPHPSQGHPWSNMSSPPPEPPKTSDCQIPIYYNTTSDANNASNAPSPYPQPQKSPAGTLPYPGDPYRYQPQHGPGPVRTNPVMSVPYQANQSWPNNSSAPQQPPYMSPERGRYGIRPPSDMSKPYTNQPPAGKVPQSAWHRAPYPSPYPPYGNEGQRRSRYGQSEIVGPVVPAGLQALQANSNNASIMQHQHTPMLVPNPHYSQNRSHQGPPMPDGREIVNNDMQQMPMRSMPSERNIYSPSANPPNPSNYYSAQSPHPQRYPSVGPLPHPMGLNSPAVSPYPVNPGTPGIGKGKNRGNKSYQCPKCVKVFRRGDHLKRHLLSVHDHEHPYQCGDCGKGFASVTALLKHAKSLHVGNLTKGLMCLRCQLTFMTLPEIETHANSLHVQEDETYMQNINTSSKQHACPSCGKPFTSAVNLKRHMQLMHRSKDDSKIFCRECGKSFARIDALRKHVEKTHNGNPNALPPDDLDDTDSLTQAPFSESESRGPSADTDESSMSTPSSSSTQWGHLPNSQPPTDQPKPSSQGSSNLPAPPVVPAYQPAPTYQPQMPNPNNKYLPPTTPGLAPVHESHQQLPPANVNPQASTPPVQNTKMEGSSDATTNRYDADSYRAMMARQNNQPIGTANSTLEAGTIQPSIGKSLFPVGNGPPETDAIEPQSVSEALSMALKTLSEFDYETPGPEIYPHPAESPGTPQLIHQNRHNPMPVYGAHHRNGVMHNMTTSVAHSIPTHLQMQHFNGNKLDVSSRSSGNFLMTMPPPPDSMTLGCLPTQPVTAAGVVQEPLQLSQLHQEGGGGVRSPMVTSNGMNAAFVNQQSMSSPRTTENSQIDRILSKFSTTNSTKMELHQAPNDESQDKTDLSCNICKTEYDCIDSLMTHIEAVHLKSNPHECCICKKHFAQAGNVKRHIRFVHLRERPFRCKDCSCTFDRLCYLQRHMRTHLQWNEENQEFNPLKPCCCPECGKRCLTAHHLRGHMQRKHFAKNKQNYAEFLAKYGHLEALGNGPGALSSQKGKRGRKRKDAETEIASKTSNMDERHSATGSMLDSSLMPSSSMQSRPLSSYQNYQCPPPRNIPVALQVQPTTYNMPRQQPQHSNFNQFVPQPCPGNNVTGVEANVLVNKRVPQHDLSNLPNYFVNQSVSVDNVNSVSNTFPNNFAQTSVNSFIAQTANTICNDNAKPKSPEVVSQKSRKHYSKLRKKLLPFRCTHCVFKRFSCLQMLKSHFAVRHDGTLKKYVCRKCGASFGKHKSLLAHKTKIHKLDKKSRSRLLLNTKPSFQTENNNMVDISVQVANSPSVTPPLYQMQYPQQIYSQHNMLYGPSTSNLNYFGYDPNSPAMVPSPNVETVYMTPAHHINTPMPLIQT